MRPHLTPTLQDRAHIDIQITCRIVVVVFGYRPHHLSGQAYHSERRFAEQAARRIHHLIVGPVWQHLFPDGRVQDYSEGSSFISSAVTSSIVGVPPVAQ